MSTALDNVSLRKEATQPGPGAGADARYKAATAIGDALRNSLDVSSQLLNEAEAEHHLTRAINRFLRCPVRRKAQSVDRQLRAWRSIASEHEVEVLDATVAAADHLRDTRTPISSAVPWLPAAMGREHGWTPVEHGWRLLSAPRASVAMHHARTRAAFMKRRAKACSTSSHALRSVREEEGLRTRSPRRVGAGMVPLVRGWCLGVYRQAGSSAWAMEEGRRSRCRAVCKGGGGGGGGGCGGGGVSVVGDGSDYGGGGGREDGGGRDSGRGHPSMHTPAEGRQSAEHAAARVGRLGCGRGRGRGVATTSRTSPYTYDSYVRTYVRTYVRMKQLASFTSLLRTEYK